MLKPKKANTVLIKGSKNMGWRGNQYKPEIESIYNVSRVDK
jgi:hypothetical protein